MWGGRHQVSSPPHANIGAEWAKLRLHLRSKQQSPKLISSQLDLCNCELIFGLPQRAPLVGVFQICGTMHSDSPPLSYCLLCSTSLLYGPSGALSKKITSYPGLQQRGLVLQVGVPAFVLGLRIRPLGRETQTP